MKLHVHEYAINADQITIIAYKTCAMNLHNNNINVLFDQHCLYKLRVL